MKGGYGKVDRVIIEDPTLTPESGGGPTFLCAQLETHILYKVL